MGEGEKSVYVCTYVRTCVGSEIYLYVLFSLFAYLLECTNAPNQVLRGEKIKVFELCLEASQTGRLRPSV